MQAAPGAELACRAHNLPATHPAAPRGIISYYATSARAGAETMGDRLAGIEALAQEDAQVRAKLSTSSTWSTILVTAALVFMAAARYL